MTSNPSLVRKDTIEYPLRLIFDEKGGVRMLRNPANLGRGERELTLTVTLPRKLFRTPALSATLTIADPGDSQPAIDITGIETQMREALGLDVRIEIMPKVEG